MVTIKDTSEAAAVGIVSKERRSKVGESKAQQLPVVAQAALLQPSSSDAKPLPWSESLIGATGGIGGMGLQLCGSRAKQLHRCTRRAVLQLLETSHLFEVYAQDLIKAASVLHHSIASSFIENTEQHIPTIHQLTVASSTSYLGITKSIKGIASEQLERFLGTYDDASRLACERHQASRRLADKARQKALTAQSVYIAVHKEVHVALVDWYKEHGNSNNANHESLPPFPGKINSKLSQLQSCEARYRRLVLEENECVRQCQRLETMALESLQMLEEDRRVISVHSWTKLLTASSSSDAKVAPDMENTAEAMISEKMSPKRALRKNSLSGIIMTVDEEDGAGAMDAETLGLPMEIGQLRDRAQKLATARWKTVQATRVLASFVESVTAASLKFGEGLKHQQSNGLDSVRDAMRTANECERVVSLWNALVTSLGHHGTAPMQLSEQLKVQLDVAALEQIFQYGDKVLKPYTERDNATWKQLCDAARSQARAEARYREATAHKAKARERCRSVDSVGTNSASLVNVAGKHMTQSIASMLSILPNGGEHAMKVLDPTTRASVAHSNLEEADHKETKERQLLDSAMELTSLSMDAYKSSAETLMDHCEGKLSGYGTLLAALVDTLKEFQTAQKQNQPEPYNQTSSRPWEGIVEYLNGWSAQVKESLSGGRESIESNGAVQSEPCLSVVLEESEIVQKALRTLDFHSETALDASEANDDDTEVDTFEDTMDSSVNTTPLRERAASASSVVMPTKSPIDESATGWLLRSFTDTESIFGKLSMTRKIPRAHQPVVGTVDTETGLFARYFWPEELEFKSTLRVIRSFACSFRDGSQRFPFQYGRVFMTDDQLMFVGWTRKQLTLLWTSVVGITPVQNRLSDQDELVVKCRKHGIADESYMILSGFYDRHNALTLIEKLREQKRQSLEAPTPAPTDHVTPPPTPSRTATISPEVTMAKMVAVVSGRLQALSIQNYYDSIWSERTDETTKPFYQSFLEKECFDVAVGPWELGDYTGVWCGEHYSQKREVQFKVKRKTHLYIGPPIASVMQTHLCRVEDSDRCVVQIRVEIDGIPYGDTFAVEIRWVATRDGESDICIDVGVEVDFKKSTMLKGKIRAGTIEETTSVHKDLFATIQSTCAALSGVEPLPSVNKEPQIPTTQIELPNVANGADKFNWRKGLVLGGGALLFYMLLFRLFWPRTEQTCPAPDVTTSSSDLSAFDVKALSSKMDHLETEMKLVRETLSEILSHIRPNDVEKSDT